MELSKENQEWFNENTEINPDAGVPIFYEGVVEEKLLQDQQKIQELENFIKQEGKKLDVVALLKSYGPYHSQCKILRTEPRPEKWLEERMDEFYVEDNKQ